MPLTFKLYTQQAALLVVTSVTDRELAVPLRGSIDRPRRPF